MADQGDEELSLVLSAQDELSGVVESADETVAAAAASMEESWAAAAAAAEPIGEAIKTAADEAKTGTQEIVDSIEAIPEAAEDASARSSAAFQGMGESARGAGEAVGGMAAGGGLLAGIAEKAHAAHIGFRAMHMGAQLAHGGTEQLAHSIAGLGTRLIGAIASGNLFVAGVTLAATAIGIFTEKEKQAAEEEKKALKELSDEIKKTEQEATSAAEKSTSERKTIAKSLADAQIEAIHVEDDAIAEHYQKAVAKEAEHHKQVMADLAERQQKNNEVLAKAESEVGKAKTPEQKTAADAAVKTAEKAKAENEAAMAAEREAHALQQQNSLNEKNLAYSKQDLEIRKKSLDLINRLADERRKGLEALDKEIANKTFLLGLTKQEREHATELKHIQDLRNAGLSQYADKLEQLLRVQIAIEQAEKDKELIEERIREQTKADKESTARAGESELLTEQMKLGHSENYLKLLREMLSIRDSIRQKEEQGLSHVKAVEEYHAKINELLEEENRKIEKQKELYARQTQDLIQTAIQKQKELDLSNQMSAAQEKGDAAAIFALRERIKAQEDFNAQFDLRRKYNDEIQQAIKDGDKAHADALRQQYEIEKKILDIKKEETEQEKIHNDLAAAGIKVSGSGITATHADKGLRRKWQERNIRDRERKLHKQAEFQGSQWGDKDSGPLGITTEGDFNAASGGGGDMDSKGGEDDKVYYDANGNPYLKGKHHKKKNALDLLLGAPGEGTPMPPELPTGPGIPKVPGAPNAPGLSGDTGDQQTLKSQLDAVNQQLENFKKQHEEVAKAFGEMGKHLEPMVDVTKQMGDDAKKAADSADKVKQGLDGAKKALDDLTKKVQDAANASTGGLAAIKAEADATKAALDRLIKAFDDLKKGG